MIPNPGNGDAGKLAVPETVDVTVRWFPLMGQVQILMPQVPDEDRLNLLDQAIGLLLGVHQQIRKAHKSPIVLAGPTA